MVACVPHAHADELFSSIPDIARESDQVSFKDAIIDYYTRHNFKTKWADDDGLEREGRQLLERIEDSWTHGLNPARYHLSEIHEIEERGEERDMPALEAYLMDAYLRYATDLGGIRVNPYKMKLRKNDWKKPAEPEFYLSILDEKSLSGAFDAIEPKGKSYQEIRKMLKEMVEKERENSPPPHPRISMKGHVRPEQSHEIIPVIRERLNADFNKDNPEFYDKQLFDRVVRFQYRNGLYADGIIGRRTIAALNKTRREKIDQLVATLERLRWISDERPSQYALVNIPATTLFAIKNGRVELEMPIIVGTKKRQTMPFITEISGVRLNPKWTVPPTIKREDIWPKLVEDPEYLKNKGIELIAYNEDGQPQTLDPMQVNWEEEEWERVNAMRMVQGAGANNPLGRIRVLMPNNYNIYLHSTNHPEYFNGYDLALSSGCIRMKEPEAFAEFVLRNRDGWEDDTLSRVLEEGETVDMLVKEKIPVYILYHTVWLDDQGDVVVGQDIYSRDLRLINVLKRLDGYGIPLENI